MSFEPGNSDRSLLISNQLSLKIVTSLSPDDVAVSGFEACFLSNNHLWLPQCLEGWSNSQSQERKMEMRAFPPSPTHSILQYVWTMGSFIQHQNHVKI